MTKFNEETANIGNIRPVDIITLIYLVTIAFLILVFRGNTHRWDGYLVAHVAAIGFVILLVVFRYKLWLCKFLSDWYPVLGYALFYEEVGRLINLVFPSYFDLTIISIEYALFGSQPSLWLGKTLNWAWISEFFHFTYFSYYSIIPITGLIFYIKKRSEEFDLYIFTVSLTFYFCFIIFILFPAAGPRFAIPEAQLTPLPGKYFVPLVNFLLDKLEIEGAAFPSSHVAVAVVLLIFVLRYEKRLLAIFAPVIIGLIVSTVYGRFHYAIDTIAGIGVGILLTHISPSVFKRIQWNIEKLRSGLYVGSPLP